MVTSLGAGRFPEEKGRREETGHLSSQDEINVHVGDKGTFLPAQSHQLPGDHLQYSGVKSPRQQNPGSRTNCRAAGVAADPAATLHCPPGIPGCPCHLLAASSVPARQSALPAAGLTRGLEPLSCPLVAIQGKPRGSRRSPRASAATAAVQMGDT